MTKCSSGKVTSSPHPCLCALLCSALGVTAHPCVLSLPPPEEQEGHSPMPAPSKTGLGEVGW